jgi:hypothetical protein
MTQYLLVCGNYHYCLLETNSWSYYFEQFLRLVIQLAHYL